MHECPNLENCGFMKKYADTKSLAIKGFITMYCKGENQASCERMKHKQTTGTAPSDDMLPSGGFVRA